jgi:hypothetical protein
MLVRYNCLAENNHTRLFVVLADLDNLVNVLLFKRSTNDDKVVLRLLERF